MVAIVIAVIMRFVIYNYTGWKQFSMNAGDNFLVIGENDTIPNIQFKNCMYTVTGKNGKSYSQDVSAALNRMTAAFVGKTDPRYVFKLADPGLDTNSFQIEGYNDAKSTRDPNIWDGQGTTATLTGYYKFIN